MPCHEPHTNLVLDINITCTYKDNCTH